MEMLAGRFFQLYFHQKQAKRNCSQHIRSDD